MPKWLEAILPYLESLNFISGIVIAIAAVIALRQLKLAKLSMNIQSKRDALKLTAQECAKYFERIVPMQNDLDQTIEKLNPNLISNWQVSITKEAIEVTIGDIDDSDEADPYFQKITDLLNAMEAFSSFFMSGVADEKVAYNIVGTNFIDVLSEYIGWAVFCNKEGYYKNLIDLYICWYSRNQQEKLKDAREAIKKQIDNLPKIITYVVGTD